MTPEEQRAPKAFMKVYFDARRPSELSFARPPHSADAGIVELVDRGLMLHFIGIAEGLQDRVREIEAADSYATARRDVDAAREEIDAIDDLILTLESRRGAVARSLELKSD